VRAYNQRGEGKKGFPTRNATMASTACLKARPVKFNREKPSRLQKDVPEKRLRVDHRSACSQFDKPGTQNGERNPMITDPHARVSSPLACSPFVSIRQSREKYITTEGDLLADIFSKASARSIIRACEYPYGAGHSRRGYNVGSLSSIRRQCNGDGVIKESDDLLQGRSVSRYISALYTTSAWLQGPTESRHSPRSLRVLEYSDSPGRHSSRVPRTRAEAEHGCH
jgi:hypothetical protein